MLRITKLDENLRGKTTLQEGNSKGEISYHRLANAGSFRKSARCRGKRPKSPSLKGERRRAP